MASFAAGVARAPFSPATTVTRMAVFLATFRNGGSDSRPLFLKFCCDLFRLVISHAIVYFFPCFHAKFRTSRFISRQRERARKKEEKKRKSRFLFVLFTPSLGAVVHYST